MRHRIHISFISTALVFCFFSYTALFAQDGVLIDPSGTLTRNPSAVLQVSPLQSTSPNVYGGFLAPQVDIADLATAAPISSPAEGLIVYNTNTTTGKGYYYWDGGKWVRLMSGNTPPLLTETDPTFNGAATTTSAIDRAGDIKITGSNSLIFTGTGVHNAIQVGNNNIINANLLTISDPGAGEGIIWTGSTGPWTLDVSPLARSNADGNFNIYGTANNIALWRPTLFVKDAANYATATPQASGGLDFTTTGNGHLSFNPGGTGNVGVGTTAPSQALDVNGKIRMRTGASTGFIPVSSADGTMTWTNPNSIGADITTASNGLYETSDDIRLGGTLTEATTITQGAHTMTFNLNGTGDFDIQDNGTSAFFVRNDGNVGIGTTTPTYKLDVDGDFRVGASSTSGLAIKRFSPALTDVPGSTSGIQLIGPVNAHVVLDIQGNDANDGFYVRVPTTLQTSPTVDKTAFVVKASGNVGINTTTPSQRLDVNGKIRMRTGASTGYIPVSSSDGTMTWTNPNAIGADITTASNGLYETSDDIRLGGTLTEATTITQGAHTMTFNLNGTGDFDIQDNGTSAFFVRDDGNVGIGTTGPSQKLHVSGNIKGDELLILDGNRFNLCSYSLNGTPTNGVKIKTNIPYSNGSQMPVVILEGYN